MAELDALAAVVHSRLQQERANESTAVTTQPAPVHPPPTTGVAPLQVTPAVQVHPTETSSSTTTTTSSSSTTTEASEFETLKTKYEKMKTYCEKVEDELQRKINGLKQAKEKVHIINTVYICKKIFNYHDTKISFTRSRHSRNKLEDYLEAPQMTRTQMPRSMFK